jgi:hypothetical protein
MRSIIVEIDDETKVDDIIIRFNHGQKTIYYPKDMNYQKGYVIPTTGKTLTSLFIKKLKNYFKKQESATQESCVPVTLVS